MYSSVAKLVASGADYHKAYLTYQEFFEKLRNEPQRWGKPFSALLGALDAQLEIGAAAIGGKDSMSGSFMDKDVPPTLISFAIAPLKADDIISPEFKNAGHPVYLFCGNDAESKLAAWDQFFALAGESKVCSAWAVENCLAEAVMKMSFGNRIGFAAVCDKVDWYHLMPGAIVAEMSGEVADGILLGYTTESQIVAIGEEKATIEELVALNEAVLEYVYPKAVTAAAPVPVVESKPGCSVAPVIKTAKPKVLIPVFPGTNCEYDTARAFVDAGAEAEIAVIRNLSSEDVARSVADFAERFLF